MKPTKKKIDVKEFRLWRQMLSFSSGPAYESHDDKIKRVMVKYKLTLR